MTYTVVVLFVFKRIEIFMGQRPTLLGIVEMKSVVTKQINYAALLFLN